jgi:hypothetical protein
MKMKEIDIKLRNCEELTPAQAWHLEGGSSMKLYQQIAKSLCAYEVFYQSGTNQQENNIMETIIKILGDTQIIDLLKIKKLADIEVAYSWAVGWLIRNIANPDVGLSIPDDQARAIQGHMAVAMELSEHTDLGEYMADVRACLSLICHRELAVLDGESFESMTEGLTPYEHAKFILNRHRVLVKAEHNASLNTAEKNKSC